MTSDYISLSVETVRNSDLSLRAVGLLAAMLTYPAGTSISVASVAEEATEGRQAIRSAMRELAEAGHVHRILSSGGRLRIEHETWVSAEPVTWCEADGCRDCKARKDAGR